MYLSILQKHHPTVTGDMPIFFLFKGVGSRLSINDIGITVKKKEILSLFNWLFSNSSRKSCYVIKCHDED